MLHLIRMAPETHAGRTTAFAQQGKGAKTGYIQISLVLACFEASVLSLAMWEVGGLDISADWLAGGGASSREHQGSWVSASFTRDGQTALGPEKRTSRITAAYLHFASVSP